MNGRKIVSAPRLNSRSIERAVRLLDTWKGKLTWDRYLDELARVLGHRYTKVAMLNRPRIAEAWQLAKQRLPSAKIRTEDTALAKASERLEALQHENERLVLENDRLKEQFLRWQYNAYQQKGLTIDHLDRPLHPVDRGATRGKKSETRRTKDRASGRRPPRAGHDGAG